MTEMSRALNRQLGVMIDRRGYVTHVIVGDAHQLFIPDLKRHRAGSSRFRGIRLVHTHLRGEGLSEDDLTDLSLLRLDAVVVLSAGMDGLPGFMEVGTIRPDAPADDATPWAVERRKSLNDWPTNYLAFIEELEGQIGSSAAIQRVPGAEGAIVIGVSTSKHDETPWTSCSASPTPRACRCSTDFSSVAASRTTSMWSERESCRPCSCARCSWTPRS